MTEGFPVRDFCCVACFIPDNTAQCLNPSCRCHWYSDPIYGEGRPDNFKVLNCPEKFPEESQPGPRK